MFPYRAQMSRLVVTFGCPSYKLDISEIYILSDKKKPPDILKYRSKMYEGI